MSQSIETRQDVVTSGVGGSARYWELEFDAAEKEEKDYRKLAAALVKKYRAEDDNKFNIFWANIETLKPATYSRRPLPNIRQRIKRKKDPLSREIGLMLESALEYSCDEYPFDDVVKDVRDDRLITGRGTARIVYEPIVGMREQQIESIDPMTGLPMIAVEMVEEIVEQRLHARFVNWEDYRQSPAKCYEEVRWQAFKSTPNREELVKEFGEEIGKSVPLNYHVLDNDTRQNGKEAADNDVFKRAEVWEIWDKVDRKRIWFVRGYDKLLKEEDDPYNLAGFFPAPKPFYGIKTTDSMVPIPDYEVYKAQAAVVNKTTIKIDKLTDELVVKGLYNSVTKEVQKLVKVRESVMIPVLNMDPGAKVSDMVKFWPIEEIANTLLALYKARDQAVQVIYQITGLSDIVRGATQASETATAQQLKGNFANMRLSPHQQGMQEFIRDLFRLKAEIIAEHFEPEILSAMTGYPVQSVIDPATGQIKEIGLDQMMPILRDDKMRSYKIDIETDSTIQPDEDADKQRRIEFMTAVTGFITQIAPIVQAGAIPPEVAKALISFGVRGFKVGREIEDALDSIGSAPPQQKGPSPEEIEAKMKEKELQMDAMKHDKELRFKVQDSQADRQKDMAIALMNGQQQMQMNRENQNVA